MKWAFIGINMGEFRKPLNQVMTKQQLGIKVNEFSSILVAFVSGMIWTRYCFVVTPVNYMLGAGSLFLGCSGGFQLYRKW